MTDIINIDNTIDEMDAILHNMRSENRLEQIEMISEKLSPIHAWLRLFADYNYQVENGGHSQYFGNGYHSTTQIGCMENISTNCDVLQKLVESTSLYINDFEHLTPVFEVMKKIRIEIETEEYEECFNCHNGQVEEYNEDTEEDESVECPECFGNSQIYNDNYNDLTKETHTLFEKLDDDLYAANDKFLKELDEKIIDLIAKYKK